MFNVLSDNLKKAIKVEYRLRLAIVACVWVIILELSMCIFLLPSVIISFYKEREVNQEIQTATEVAGVQSNLVSQTITSTNQTLRILNDDLLYPPATPAFETVLSARTPAIHITELSYTDQDATSGLLSVHGVAASREALVSFEKALQDSGSFSSVDLPVSNLAKDTNIDFTINVGIGTHT